MAKKGLNRECIVDAAEALAEEKGVENLTLHELAGALGIKTSSLYNHLRGLPELNARLTERAFERLLGALKEAEGELDAFLARVRAIQGFRDYCVLHRRYRLGQPWAQVRTDLQATFGRPLTLRTVHNWHRAALDQARALWESAA